MRRRGTRGCNPVHPHAGELRRREVRAAGRAAAGRLESGRVGRHRAGCSYSHAADSSAEPAASVSTDRRGSGADRCGRAGGASGSAVDARASKSARSQVRSACRQGESQGSRPTKDVVAQNAATPKAAPLDLTSLETRLKETQAIGFMTKIALKNQVDDLLNQFRAFYAGKLKTTLAELRRPYDLLVLKVLSLLQDSDPSLAAAIVASREAIWGILSDRMKFAKFASA